MIAGGSVQANLAFLGLSYLLATSFTVLALMVFLRKGSRMSKTQVCCSGRKGGQRRDQGPVDHSADIFALGF